MNTHVQILDVRSAPGTQGITIALRHFKEQPTMRVLVTGGAGYIGSVVADRLLRNGHSVTVLDNLSKGHREAVPAQAEFVQADTGDTAALAGIFEAGRFDAVMHFAASIEVGESVVRPEKFFDNNC